jgi:hypothetical protein
MLKTFSITFLTLATFQIFTSVNEFHHDLPTPVQIKEDSKLTETRHALRLLGQDLKYVDPVYHSALANDIDPVLWACNVRTESQYKINAVSPMGYKGLAQTRKAVMKTGYEVGDLTYGSCELRDKLRIAKGDMVKALTFYKGSATLYDKQGNKTKGHQQALEVLELYAKIKEQMKG